MRPSSACTPNRTLDEADARGRHHPLRGPPHPPARSRARSPTIATPHPRFGGTAGPSASAAARSRASTPTASTSSCASRAASTIHSHLRMTGSWGVHRDGQRWRALAAPRVARPAPGRQRGRPVRRPGARAAHRVAHALRPPARAARPRHPRARASTSASSCAACARTTRRAPIGDALLDQRTIAGIGNLWKSEGCFAARSTPGARPARSPTTRRSRSSARCGRGCSSPRGTASRTRHRAIYAQAGRPCPRCGAPIHSRGQGDDNRTTYWCPGCQT